MKKLMIFLSLIVSVVVQGIDVEERTYNYRETNFIIEGRIPVFKEGDRTVSTGAHDKFQMMSEIIALESGRYFTEERGSALHSFILKGDFSKKNNKLGVDSFLVKTYYFTGGEHGMILESPYNFYKGKILNLEDIFKKDVNYKRLIKNKIEEIIIEEDPSLFYENVTVREKEFKFFFEEDNLVIIFNPYEIGPHESGIPAFKIPVSDISDHLRTSFTAAQ